MIARSQDIQALRTHLRNLQFAVATTHCPRTAAALKQMLEQAETQLRARETAPERH